MKVSHKMLLYERLENSSVSEMLTKDIAQERQKTGKIINQKEEILI